ncbi:MAG TPA: CaiB/BaiF CoA-transferase family protein [Acidiferrobacterales bacterium]|nr:CaiB/BaiF CoA-transferase family protein [Acidiferrobacterales bacterium]
MRPLEGIKVIGLEQAIAAPFATRQLADLGAEVIKIERPRVGDFARGYDETVNGMSAYFVWVNRSKQSLTLDVKHPQAAEILKRLIATADVFVQNLVPGAAARLGLSADALRAQHPRLIVCDISGYGDSGPYRDKKAYDLLIQSEAGLLSVTGTRETPCKAGISIADISAGMYAYSGVLTALYQREKTGRGTRVEVSLLESLGEWMGHPLYYSHYGKPLKRTGAAHATIAPYGPFRAKDGGVMLGIQNEREWALFCERVLDRPELAQDERFNTISRRAANRAELHAVIGQGFAGLTVSEVVARLDTAQIANAHVNEMNDVWDHPQFQARGRWREVTTPAGVIPALLPPATSADFDIRMDPVPALGEHTDAILQTLGYTASDIAALRSAGAV